MKLIKHLSMLLAAALITVTTYAQTDGTKPVAKPAPAATKSPLLSNQKPLKMQPPTKLPVSKPVQPAKPAAGTK